jgi:hypothetical protein
MIKYTNDYPMIKRMLLGDNYGGGVVIMDFDIHYQVDTMGSRQEGAK